MFSPQNAFIFLIDYLFGFYILAVWLRLFLQYRRANFYNPICQLIIKATDPFLIPLRRVIPGFKGIDLASVVLLFLVAVIELILILLIRGFSLDSDLIGIVLIGAIINIARAIINSFFWGIILRALLSYLPQGQFSPLSEITYHLSEPLLKPIRKIVPATSGFDLSPVFALLGLGFIKILFGL